MKRILLPCAAAAALLGAAPAQIGSQPPGTTPVQVRLVEQLLDKSLTVEADLASNQIGIVLVSSDDHLVAMTGIVSPFILPQVILPLTWRSPLTCAADVSLRGTWPGQKVYFQVLCGDPAGKIAASGVACYEVREPGTPLPQAPLYTGPTVSYEQMAIMRAPPLPCTFAVKVTVTVTSSDWHLWHQATVCRAEGTDIVLILKEPGPGEGLLDVVETHEIVVDVGIQPANPLRLLIARTAEPAPQVGQLIYEQVIPIRDPVQ